jgi:DNA repair exonuclease SbcCD ATPase subunit
VVRNTIGRLKSDLTQRRQANKRLEESLLAKTKALANLDGTYQTRVVELEAKAKLLANVETQAEQLEELRTGEENRLKEVQKEVSKQTRPYQTLPDQIRPREREHPPTPRYIYIPRSTPLTLPTSPPPNPNPNPNPNPTRLAS